MAFIGPRRQQRALGTNCRGPESAPIEDAKKHTRRFRAGARPLPNEPGNDLSKIRYLMNLL